MAQYPFRAEPIKKYEEIPAGLYLCEIIKTDLRTTKDGNGRYIFLQFRIKEGEYKGRQIFQRITTLNKSKDAMNIGKKHLSTLCHSLEIDSFNDTDELLNHETIINLREGNKLYGFLNAQNSEYLLPANIENSNFSEEPPMIPPDEFIDDKIPF